MGSTLPFRMEVDLRDCEVEGRLPADLRGSFYRIGPDFQYPPRLPNIPFDGEGHLGMFRFADGHVDYRSRYVRTQRYKAQAAARESLFGTYRNPYTDDPRVKGLSRGTANTSVVFHHGKLLVLKEDSPPVVRRPGHARDARRLLHLRRPAQEPHVHRASEDRLRDRRAASRSATRRAARRPTTSRS